MCALVPVLDPALVVFRSLMITNGTRPELGGLVSACPLSAVGYIGTVLCPLPVSPILIELA